MQAYDVVIPAWNAEATLGETLGSVFAQTVPPARVIVVDDGSTDGTPALARAAGAEVIVQANTGPGAATTNGIAAASAPILATVDADDLWHPEKMERQLAVLAAATRPTAVTTLQRQFAHGRPDDGTGEVRAGLNRSSLVVPLDLARQVGPVIDPPGNCGDMVDWLTRAREAGIALHQIDEVLAYRRIMPGSLSWRRDAQADRGYLFVAHAALLRNRQKAGKP